MSEASDDPFQADNPPITETAIGVQFAPIAGFTAAHYGWFWKECLDSTWTKTQDAPRLAAQFERFGEDIPWVSTPLIPFVLQSATEADRILIISKEGERVIQLQNSKFLYNWRRRLGEYPSFKSTCPEFIRLLSVFETFLKDADLDSTPYDQWEVTYFNQIPKGPLWQSRSDWRNVLPGLLDRIHPESGVAQEPTGEWRFEIPPHRGRIHISVQHIKIESGGEALSLNMTARGPIAAGDGDRDLLSGLNLGHEMIVRTFWDITSPAAHAHWGKR